MWLRSTSCALCLVVLVAACGSGAKVKLSENSHQAGHPAGLGHREMSKVPVSHAPGKAHLRCVAAATTAGSSSVAYAALVEKEAVVRAEPTDSARVVGRLTRLGKDGFREVLGVIGIRSSARCTPNWYRVQLSVLPNGTTGWARASTVQTFRVPSRIVVDLSQRNLRLYRRGKLVFETPVAVGAPATPTPLGHYFVNQRYVLPDASGPFGPNALGISAHSNALQNDWVENGPIGIHGTNEAWSIGQAASHGCIRLNNDVMRRLFPLAPAGTPVIVHP